MFIMQAKVVKFNFCFLGLLLFGFYAFTQSDFRSQSIVVNPYPSYQVNVFVDKDPSGNGSPSYTIDEEIRIGVQPSEASYIYLFNIRSNGTITQILPNRLDSYGADHFVQAGHTRYFPSHDSRYRFTIDGPEGLDKVLAVASKQPLDTHTLASFTSGRDFATSSMGETNFASTLSIIVNPLPSETWVTDTALFYVTGFNRPAPPPYPVYPPSPVYPPPVTQYGTIDVTTYPAGATIYVDGQFMGYAPTRLSNINTGSRVIRLELNGYVPFNTTVNLRANEVYPINVNLQANNYNNYRVPASKDDCKKDRWQYLRRHDGTIFRNQGDCISYVNHYYGRNYHYDDDDDDDDD